MTQIPNFTEILEFEKLPLPRLTDKYLEYRRSFRELLRRADIISRGSGGIISPDNKTYYASLLFTRMYVTAKSVSQLLPDCRPREHWDFSAVASLVRTMYELYLWYFWLCIDDVDADERQARFVLLYCYDNGSRIRLNVDATHPPEPNEVMNDLRKRFDENPFLRQYNETNREKALKGQKMPFIQDEVIERIGLKRDDFRYAYRFLSEHLHGGPVAYFRMQQHNRGTGIETQHEKIYMVFAIANAIAILMDSIEWHLSIFPDAETRMPHLTSGQIWRNVEIGQGRKKKK